MRDDRLVQVPSKAISSDETTARILKTVSELGNTVLVKRAAGELQR